ncbi:MAG TPA: TadE/TadG family type IV pilus assembly protein [Nocardioides sp.]|nr:TadE/TadG family type IV pilus assembly protein [Nocardioides sp.]
MKRVLRVLRARDEGGAVAVEAALITPILCMLVFGIIEFAFLLRDYSVVASDVRTAGRIASTGAGFGPGTCDTSYDDPPPCTPGNSPALAQLAADAIQREGSAMPNDSINYLLIYQANDKGYPGANGNTTMPSSCAGVSQCVRFIWKPHANGGQGGFRYAEGTWKSSTISACFPGTGSASLDRVGVYLNATHKMMTGIFGSAVTVSDHAAFDFEPLPTASCNGTGSTSTGGHS